MGRTRERIIPCRIKVRPEDFRVEEISDLRPGRRGRYRLYRLTKTGWNTVDLIVRLARDMRLPREVFSFGGRKDRWAVTSQLVTIRDRADRSTRGPDFILEALGSVDESMTPQRIRANAFTIVLRDLDDADLPSIEAGAEAARSAGLPNYYDDQRFGSFDPERGFVGEAILAGRWETALRVHLTLPPPDAPEAAGERGRRIEERWGDWKGLLAASRTVTERRVFQSLIARHGDFRGAFGAIPRDAVSMALAAFQSHIWNRIACGIAEGAAEETVWAPGVAGPYAFPIRWSRVGAPRIQRLAIPLPGPRARMRDADLAQVYAATLEASGLREESFARPGPSGPLLRSVPRPFLLRPDRLRVIDIGADELRPGRMRCTATFRLPRGCYGTMVVKRLAIRA
jgi:tRNA pseudouridine13 synthase